MSCPENVFCTVAIIGEGEKGIAATAHLVKNGIDAKYFEVEGTAFGRTFIPEPPPGRIEQSGTMVRIKGSKIIFAGHVIMRDPQAKDNIEYTPNYDFLSKDHRSRVHFINEGMTVMEVAEKVRQTTL